MNMELITIGTELLLGFTVDTNAAELGQQRDRPRPAALGEDAAVEVTEPVRRGREQREEHAHVASTPTTQASVATRAYQLAPRNSQTML